MIDFSLFDVLRAMLNKLWLILLSAFFFATATFIYTSSFVTPVYASSSSILISNGGILTEAQYYGSRANNNVINSSDINASTAIKNTCIDILTTSKMFELLADELNLSYDYTPSELRGMISLASRSEDSLVLDITVTGTRKDDLAQIANTFSEVAPDYIKAKLSFVAIDINDTAQGSHKVSPRIALSTGIALVIGALLVMIPVFLFTVFDKTIKGEEDFAEKYPNISVLGVVPDFLVDTKGGEY